MKKVAFIFFGVLLTAQLFAQNPARTGKDYAYLFYVSKFDHGVWTSLPDTKNEIQAIAEELDQNYGFEVQVEPNPTKARIEEILLSAGKRNYGPNDQVLFFFSTHGYFFEDEDRGYLIPRNGKAKRNDPLRKSWLSYEDLGSYISLVKCDHILVSLDACYSGAFGDRWKSKPSGFDEIENCPDVQTKALFKDSRLYYTSGSKKQKTPAQSKFARAWLSFLEKGEGQILTTNELHYALGRVTNPKPESGTFTKAHKGGDFVFLHKDGCTAKPSATVVTPVDLGPSPADSEPNSKMVFLAGNQFVMGDSSNTYDEKAHEVIVFSYFIGKCEVTVKEFKAFVDDTGYVTTAEKLGKARFYESGGGWVEKEGLNWRYDPWGKVYSPFEYNKPVVFVSWYDAISYCNWLSKEHALDTAYVIDSLKVEILKNANGYRLPTEAEWEYAARSGGLMQKFAGTSNEDDIVKFANTRGRIDGFSSTAPVGSFEPNDIGLFDMSGNVFEWCWDGYTSNYYDHGEILNPMGSEGGTLRTVRGGSWWTVKPRNMTNTYRGRYEPTEVCFDVGFRLARWNL